MRIVGIDPGSEISGICTLDEGRIVGAAVVDNSDLWDRIVLLSGFGPVILVIEDIQPFLMRLTPQVIAVAKFIGILWDRALRHGVYDQVILVPRNVVKKWIFNSCPELVARIDKKMLKLDAKKVKEKLKGLRKDNGDMRAASFHYVDDRVVIAGLKTLFNIPTPKPGKPNIFGLHSHSWNALAVSGFIERTSKSLLDQAAPNNT